jgi:hypothetical protein
MYSESKHISLNKTHIFINNQQMHCGPDSSVGIATGYGLDGHGSNPGGSDIVRTCPAWPWGPTSLLCNGYRVFLRGRKRPERDADPSPLLVLRSKKQSSAIRLLSLRAFVACKNGETNTLIYSCLLFYSATSLICFDTIRAIIRELFRAC